MDADPWVPWIGQLVVVDTSTPYVYVGTLAEVKPEFVVLKDVDAHDRQDGSSTKERYVMDVKRFGVKPNRKEVSVRKVQVVSLSRLDDILVY